MEKQKQQEKQIYDLDDFEHYCHLWNIVPGGSQGLGIVQLRKIVDSIQANNYSRPGSKMPSILVTGKGKMLAVKAFVNSLSIRDVRVCSSKYMDDGINSSLFFGDSTSNTAHVITNIERLTSNAESILWRNLSQRECHYYNFTSKKWDTIHYCNGLIIMTARKANLISEQILKEIDYAVKLDPLTPDQQCLVVHLQLKFCGIDYEGKEQVLQAIVDAGLGQISIIMQLLRICIMLMRAEMEECITMAIVKKADRLFSMPVLPPASPNDDIPF
jgi:hypothetical protein